MPTDAHRERNKRHRQSLDQIVVTVPKGARSKIKAHADNQGMSMNGYIVSLIETDMDCSVLDLSTKDSM